MAASRVQHVFLTGPPGVGKTTLVQKVCSELAGNSVVLQGFYTEEVREQGKRTGFDIVTLDGRRGKLSRIGAGKGPSVGQYTVNLNSFESLALPVLSLQKDGSPVYVVDEIGKMELFSQGFIQSVRRLLDSPNTTVFGTIPSPKGRPLGLVDEIRGKHNVKVITISKENRGRVLTEILAALNEARTGNATHHGSG